VIVKFLKNPAVIHDGLLYAASFLTLWGADVPVGAGWDTALAAIPAAVSALVRELLVVHQTNQAIAAQQKQVS
jgi:hypothetical protein